MAFFDKLNDFAKNIGDRTTDAIETGKLNSKVNAEKNLAGEDLKKIGEFYYNLFASGGEVAPEVLEVCQSAKAHYDAAAEAQAEIDRIRAENEAAKAAAAAPVAPAAPAVPAAPAGLPCSACGTVNEPGTKFCRECGAKLEVPAEPEKRICPACSTEVAPGVKFCSECGQKLE